MEFESQPPAMTYDEASAAALELIASGIAKIQSGVQYNQLIMALMGDGEFGCFDGRMNYVVPTPTTEEAKDD